MCRKIIFIYALLYIFSALLLPNICGANSKINTTFTYTISENESIETAEQLASTMAIQETIEKVYVNIVNNSEVVDNKINKDTIYSIAAGVIKIDEKSIERIDEKTLNVAICAHYEGDIGLLIEKYNNDTSTLIKYEQLKDKFADYNSKIKQKKIELNNINNNDAIEKINEDIRSLDNEFIASIWFEKGLTEYYIGQNEEALLSFDTALTINPKYENAHAAKGLIYHHVGKIDLSIKELELALDIRPTYYEVLHTMGLIYKEKQDYNNSLYYLGRALASNPYSGPTFVLRASVYACIDNYDKAKDDYNEALKIDYMDYDAMVGLSMLETNNYYDYETGILWANKAIENSPKKYGGYLAKTMALIRMGRRKEAVKYLDNAIALCDNKELLMVMKDIRTDLINN